MTQPIPYDHFVEWDGRCPDCGCGDFLDGPRGGLCQNIECCVCGTRLNVLRNVARYGRLCMAQRIPPGPQWEPARRG